MESNAGGFINGSYYIRFSASRVNIKSDTPYKVYFENDDTVDGLQTETVDGVTKKFKWLCKSKTGSSTSWIKKEVNDGHLRTDAIGYLQSFTVTGWKAAKRFANDDKITSNIYAFIYKVQHDCLLHIDLSEGTSKSSDYGSVAVYTGSDWLQIVNYKEFSGNTDMNSSIAFPCKAGTLIRCIYGAGKFQTKDCTDTEGAGTTSQYRVHWCSCEGTDQGDIGMNATFTEFKLFSKTDNSAPDGGSDSGGGGDDSGGGSGGGDDSSGGNYVPLSLLSIADRSATWANVSKADTGTGGDGLTYTCTRTNPSTGSYTYTFNIPKVNAAQIGLDFCSYNLPTGTGSANNPARMTLKINGTVVAYSQNYPNNISGFQTYIPAGPFKSTATGDNIVIEISGAGLVEHANVIVYR